MYSNITIFTQGPPERFAAWMQSSYNLRCCCKNS